MVDFSKVFKKAQSKKADTMCVEAEDGSLSNGDLHDQLMAGVDDESLRASSYVLAKSLKASPEALKLLA